jgi:hypothetical protein
MTTSTETRLELSGVYNRGAITSVFVPEPSCVKTLTLDTATSQLFFGHAFVSYFDSKCVLTGDKIQ